MIGTFGDIPGILDNIIYIKLNVINVINIIIKIYI